VEELPQDPIAVIAVIAVIVVILGIVAPTPAAHVGRPSWI
jgi:hypothetical protein